MPSSPLPPEVDAFVTAISNPTRTEILRHLTAAEHTAPELADATGIDVTTAKRHLAILEEAGFAGADRAREKRTAGRGHAVRWHANPDPIRASAETWLQYATRTEQ